MNIIPHAFSLALFENWIYFTDWNRLGVMRVDKFGSNTSELLYNNSANNQYPMGIAAFHRTVQPSGN